MIKFDDNKKLYGDFCKIEGKEVVLEWLDEKQLLSLILKELKKWNKQTQNKKKVVERNLKK